MSPEIAEAGKILCCMLNLSFYPRTPTTRCRVATGRSHPARCGSTPAAAQPPEAGIGLRCCYDRFHDPQSARPDAPVAHCRRKESHRRRFRERRRGQDHGSGEPGGRPGFPVRVLAFRLGAGHARLHASCGFDGAGYLCGSHRLDHPQRGDAIRHPRGPRSGAGGGAGIRPAGCSWRCPVPSFIGIVLGGGSLYLIDKISPALLKKRGMGFGDVKLLAMLGAFFGWKGAP